MASHLEREHQNEPQEDPQLKQLMENVQQIDNAKGMESDLQRLERMANHLGELKETLKGTSNDEEAKMLKEEIEETELYIELNKRNREAELGKGKIQKKKAA